MRNLQQIQYAARISIADLQENRSPSLPDGVRQEEGEPDSYERPASPGARSAGSARYSAR